VQGLTDEAGVRVGTALSSPSTGSRRARQLCDDATVIGPAEREHTLARIRKICLELPETSERLSHGAPTFFVRGKRAFLMVLSDHHGDGRFAIWCAAPTGLQGTLVEADPERFFVPPYVGHRGWLGLRLDRGIDWDEIAGVVEDAYVEVAPPKLVDSARQSDPTAYERD
jgi:hypothetical protein